MGNLVALMLITGCAAGILTALGLKKVSPDHPLYILFIIIFVGGLMSVGVAFLLTLLHFVTRLGS